MVFDLDCASSKRLLIEIQDQLPPILCPHTVPGIEPTHHGWQAEGELLDALPVRVLRDLTQVKRVVFQLE